MDDETQNTAAEESGASAPPGPDAAGPGEHTEAWRDVIAQIDALGEAMGRWARAAVDDPVNRERAHEIRDHMRAMADTVGDAVDDAAKTDTGQAFKEAAAKTGEAFRTAGSRISEEVAPRASSAFRAAAEKLHQAATRMEGEARASDAAGEEGSSASSSAKDE